MTATERLAAPSAARNRKSTACVWLSNALLAIVGLVSFWFVYYIFATFLLRDVSEWDTVEDFGESAQRSVPIGVHFVAGAAVMLLAFLQLSSFVRRRYAAVHRWSGRLYALSAAVTILGGSVYTVLNSTIGGLAMDGTFLVYAALFAFFTYKAVVTARAKQFKQHRRWALRSVAMAVGSAFYRLLNIPLLIPDVADSFTRQSAITYLTVTAYFFYVPNLVVVELYLRATAAPPRPACTKGQKPLHAAGESEGDEHVVEVEMA